ncbi:phosphodiesterase [Thalassoglobus neptunius]|uniref:Phosphodiesterase n=1 Tax=Thalassoglobus neptunius TaxID=1938619 RepID=A0A5C5X7Q8_9PLAN|nr:phosphodiesterase [Thalassoglobus neptunius]
MFRFGHKRSRVSKSAGIRRPDTALKRFVKSLRDRRLQIRIGVSFVAIVLLVIALQSWKSPFQYRRGDYIEHGVAAKIEFERVDVEQTQIARERAAESVPWIFRLNSAPLMSLPEELRAALGEIAAAQTLELVPLTTRQNFGLTQQSSSDLGGKIVGDWFHAGSPAERFAILRSAIVGPDMTRAEQRIEAMVEEFREFIQPILETGLIGSDFAQRQNRNLTPDRRLLIVNNGDGLETGRIVLLPRVRLQDQLNEAGQLGYSWDTFEALSPEIRRPMIHWLIERATPTLIFDQSATAAEIAAAREQVDPRMERYLKGDLLVEPQQFLDQSHLSLLLDEYNAAESKIHEGARFSRMLVAFVMVAVLTILNGFYIAKNEPRIANNLNYLITFWVAIIATAFIGRIVSLDPLRAEIVPLLTTVLLLSVAFNQVLATMTAFSLSLLLTMATTGQFNHFLVLMATATSAIIPLKRVSTRATLIKTSFISAITFFTVGCGIAIIETQSVTEVMQDTQLLVMNAKGAALCLVAGFLVAGSLPFIESAFGVVTDMTLLELSDPSHPLLQDLVRLAPGTYNHSIAVSSIAETAAERIGGNGLLARVGAYFHDIGKMLKPQYFIENLQDASSSRHQQLNPAMSTLIIIGHVKDGVELAEQYGLPQPIIDFIEQHHGTTLVEYFYREAAKLAECKPDHKTDAEESSFRYPGPKPQTRETGVMMIADACESACRSLTEPTPKRIETLVNDIVMRRLLDGQFDECDLKMSDIRTIQDSVTKSLIGIYHGRIRYPDAPDGKKKSEVQDSSVKQPAAN